MHRIKAVNEMSACPATVRKTLWASQIAAKYGVSVKTLYAWAKVLKSADQVKVPVEGKRDFYITFNSSAFDTPALEWAVAWYLHNPLTSKIKVYEELRKEAMNNGWKVGSYQAFARIMNEPEIKVALMRAIEGRRGIANSVAPYARRDLDSLGAMEWVVGDQIVFDYTVYDDDGQIINPNAYVWVDMSTSMIVGVDVVLGKYNRYSVGRSLKMALSYAVPDAIYTDNGKPELSKYLEDIRSQLSGIRWADFDDLDPSLRHKKAKPRNSRAKPIEGIFNHVQRWMFENIAAEQGGFGYQKYTKTNKDEWVKGLQHAAKKNNLLMDYHYFLEMFARAVHQWNTHKIGGERNIVPIDAFQQRLKDSGRSRFDDATLDYIFMPRKLLQVRNSWVQLTVAGARRTYSHPSLARYVGQKVEVRWDEAAIDTVAVSTADHKFIAHADLVEKIDPRDHAALLRELKRAKEVEKAVEEAFAHYKSLYRPSYKINAYTAPANDAQTIEKEVKKINKKIAMSNKELLDAM